MLTELINTAVIKDIVTSERMKVYETSFYFDIENAPEYNYFSNIIENIPQRDKIKITLQDDSERVFDASGSLVSEEAYKEFIENTLEDEVIIVRIRIDKEVKENHFSIYSFDDFVKDILSLSIEDVMSAFSNLLKQSSTFLIFDVYSPIPMFATKTMFFVTQGNEVITPDFSRIQRIEDCKEVSYFYNFDTYEVLPDDFKITIDYKNNPLSEIFQKLSVLLSISFIATSATISGTQLKGVINGQRTLEYCCDIKNLPNNKILYGIYNWIYTGGSAIDKAIIARNVISLHCKYVSIIEMDEKVIASIQSNYNLYLKDNVKEYLELKNKVAEFISDIVSKTGEYATGLLDKFKSNLFAIFGFMFTVILANIVSSQPLNNVFTREITILIECVLIGSFVYLIICYFQSRYEIQKVIDSYEQLKRNYNEILTEDDLLEIFRNDEIMEGMKKTIRKSKKIYLGIWMVFLIGMFIVIEAVSFSPNYQYIWNFIKGIF
ncbi:hypothetical protein ACPWSR_01575 [Alloiococcus sp. CFN-8]|uniref:hypothetical protein n=1 Tax=Alloiococcus sp. CFN-8 TaxID=3416081 RepID=UPI003CEB0EC7